MPDGSARFACPSCGKSYKWKAEVAGKKVRCKCGQKMLAPADAWGEAEPVGAPPEPAPEPESYELDLPDDSDLAPPKPALAPAADGTCPNCNLALSPDAVLCLNCGFNLREGSVVQTAVSDTPAEPSEAPLNTPALSAATLAGAGTRARLEDDIYTTSPIWELYLPIVFIVSGVGLVFGISFWLTAGLLEGVIAGGVLLVAQIVLMFPLLFVGILVATKVADVGFGPAVPALFKLFSLSLGPGTIADGLYLMVSPFFGYGLYGGMARIFVLFVLYAVFIGPFMGKMFYLDLQETVNTLWVIVIVKIAAGFILMLFVFSYFLI